jgi:hypothetical protein
MTFAAVDAFDLPEWLGEGPVTWTPVGGIHDSYLVAGLLSSGVGVDLSGVQPDVLPCALLAVDEAYPTPVAADELRHQAHQAWRHGEVLLVSVDDRLTLAVPGTTFTAERVMETVGRLAKAVGARPGSYSVLLRLAD